MSESELVMRLNRLEGQVRQLTGRSSSCSTATASSSSSSRARSRRRSAARAPQLPRAPPPQPQYAPPQPQAIRRSRKRYPQQRYPPQAYPQQEAYPPATAARRRPPRRCVRSEPESERARRAAHARHPGTVAAAPPLDDEGATSRLTSARPAAARPARRSISASWRRKPRTRRRRAREVRQIPGRAAASAAAQSERHRRAADGDGADQHAEGRIRPRLRLCAAQGLCARRGCAARLHEEVSERPAGGGRELLARRDACSSASAIARPPKPSSTCRPSTRSPPRRRTRCCGSASRSPR